MKTSKPVCGVTYNTASFLVARLRDLQEAGRISQAYWVHHDPDTDAKKEHWHLVVFPTSSVDPWALAEAFTEADAEAGKPRRFLPNPDTQGRCLSLSDWLWYAIHDADYLAAKGMTRNVHYGREAVAALDGDELAQRWASLPPVRLGRQALTARALRLQKDGKTWPQIVLALGAELSRDPYLLGFLGHVLAAAAGNRQDAEELAARLLPSPTLPAATKATKAKGRKRSGPEFEGDAPSWAGSGLDEMEIDLGLDDLP